MSHWKNKTVVLEIEPALALDLEKIATKQKPKMSWNDLARRALYSYVAMHRARGAIE